MEEPTELNYDTYQNQGVAQPPPAEEAPLPSTSSLKPNAPLNKRWLIIIGALAILLLLAIVALPPVSSQNRYTQTLKYYQGQVKTLGLEGKPEDLKKSCYMTGQGPFDHGHLWCFVSVYQEFETQKDAKQIIATINDFEKVLTSQGFNGISKSGTTERVLQGGASILAGKRTGSESCSSSLFYEPVGAQTGKRSVYAYSLSCGSEAQFVLPGYIDEREGSAAQKQQQANLKEEMVKEDEEAKDISFDKTLVKAYSPSYLPSGYVGQAAFFDTAYQEVDLWVKHGSENAFSIANVGPQSRHPHDQLCPGGKYDACPVFGKTSNGTKVYVYNSDNRSDYYFIKIGDTLVAFDVGYYSNAETTLLKSEMLKIIDSLKPIN